MKITFARILFAAVVLTPAAAFAHPGDHTSMTVGQIAHHVVTSPDHLAELVMAGLVATGLGIRARRRAAR